MLLKEQRYTARTGYMKEIIYNSNYINNYYN